MDDYLNLHLSFSLTLFLNKIVVLIPQMERDLWLLGDVEQCGSHYRVSFFLIKDSVLISLKHNDYSTPNLWWKIMFAKIKANKSICIVVTLTKIKRQFH